MALTKAAIVDSISHKFKITKTSAKELVDVFFESISETLVAGEDVRISGFGRFELRDKPPRPGCNPKTGEPVEISARRVVTFKQGQKMKKHVLNKLNELSQSTEEI